MLHYTHSKYIMHFICNYARSWDLTSKIMLMSKKYLDPPSEGQSDVVKIVTPILGPQSLFRQHS